VGPAVRPGGAAQFFLISRTINSVGTRCVGTRSAYHRGVRGFRCIRPQMCNSDAPWANSPAGAPSRKTQDRRRRHGGGGRHLRYMARSNRCRRSGAQSWNCPRAPLTQRELQFFSTRSPARRRCPGLANFHAWQGIRMWPSAIKQLAGRPRFSVLTVGWISQARRLPQAEAAERPHARRTRAGRRPVVAAAVC
jgi:hypothetical protein